MPSYAMANLLPASCPKRIDWDYTTTRRRRPRVARRTSRSRRSGDEVGGLRALVLAPEHDLVAAGVLGQVHRLVRQLDEVIEVRVVVRQRRQADGDRHRAHGLQVLAGEGPRLDGVADALGEGARLLRPNVEEDEDELLAAKAVDAVVLPHGVAQDGGDLPQRDVANLVAVVVVEALEVVDVRHGDDGTSALEVEVGEVAGEVLAELEAVGQAGEDVLVGATLTGVSRVRRDNGRRHLRGHHLEEALVFGAERRLGARAHG